MRIYLFLLLGLLPLLSGMAYLGDDEIEESSSAYVISDRYSAKEIGPRIDFIIIHFTHDDFGPSLYTLTEGPVSAHYLIPDEGVHDNTIYQLVPDDKKASHAGPSYWQGASTGGQINLNSTSLGIELVNKGYKDGKGARQWFAYSDHQIDLLIALLKDLVQKYEIEPTRIIGHSDITPNIEARKGNIKVDPGPLFPWEKLAQAGIGAWYDPDAVKKTLETTSAAPVDILWLQKHLAIYGYNIQPTGVMDDQTRNVLIAFQMHFRPSDYSGTPDQETCAILKSLINKYFSK